MITNTNSTGTSLSLRVSCQHKSSAIPIVGTAPTLTDPGSSNDDGRPRDLLHNRSIQVHDLFHFIITSDTMDWKITRSMETVFYHHPHATVKIHSNSLLEETYRRKLRAFQSAGYDLVFATFDLDGLLRKWGAERGNEDIVEKFMNNKAASIRRDPFWRNNEANLLRYLLLYHYGGFYFDTDMYVQQSIPSIIMNVVGLEDKNVINNAAMAFERNHDFMSASVKEFLDTYEEKIGAWGAFGPYLITRLYENNTNFRETVTVLPPKTFQPIHWSELSRKCFQEVGHTVDLSRTLAVHTNNKFSSQYNNTKQGTLCDMVYHKYCLLFCHEGRDPNATTTTTAVTTTAKDDSLYV